MGYRKSIPEDYSGLLDSLLLKQLEHQEILLEKRNTIQPGRSCRKLILQANIHLPGIQWDFLQEMGIYNPMGMSSLRVIQPDKDHLLNKRPEGQRWNRRNGLWDTCYKL